MWLKHVVAASRWTKIFLKFFCKKLPPPPACNCCRSRPFCCWICRKYRTVLSKISAFSNFELNFFIHFFQISLNFPTFVADLIAEWLFWVRLDSRLCALVVASPLKVFWAEKSLCNFFLIELRCLFRKIYGYHLISSGNNFGVTTQKLISLQ